MAAPAASEAFQRALLDDDPVELYERAPCGYLSTAPDGTIVKANETFRTWTGYTAEALIGQRRLVELLTAGGRIYHETHYNPMLHALGEVKEIALELIKADGDRLPVLLNAVLVRSSIGEPMVVRIAVFDASDRRRYEQELLLAKQRAEESERTAVRLAQTLQQTLIPPAPPSIPDLDVAAAYRPAGHGTEVGGDFYDVFQIGEGDWVIALGDVCGKGVEAAVVTALVRHTVRALAVTESSPRELLHKLNAVLLSTESDRFCTVVVARLRRQRGGWQLTASCGGHPLPLLLRSGEPAIAVGRPGSLVGALDSAEFTEEAFSLSPGDAVLLYTDGVTEARRGGEFFGEARLCAALTHRDSPSTMVEDVVERVLDFQHHVARDDIAVLSVRVPAQPAL